MEKRNLLTFKTTNEGLYAVGRLLEALLVEEIEAEFPDKFFRT